MATQWPMFGKGYAIHFWSEKGLVKWRDEDPNKKPGEQYGAMTWQKAAKHREALGDMVIRSSEDPLWSSDMFKFKSFLVDITEVIKQAKEQGGPLDGSAVAREYKRRRPVSRLIPKIVDLD